MASFNSLNIQNYAGTGQRDLAVAVGTSDDCIVPGVSGNAVPVDGMAALAGGKAAPAILVVAPVDLCTSKSPTNDPVVLILVVLISNIIREIISTVH